MDSSELVDPNIECRLCSPTPPKSRLAQTTVNSSRFGNVPVEEGPPVSPFVFFSSLELVLMYHDQTFLKLRRRMRGQRSRQRKMKTLRLRPRLLDRTRWRKVNRASLAEETILHERKGSLQM